MVSCELFQVRLESTHDLLMPCFGAKMDWHFHRSCDIYHPITAVKALLVNEIPGKNSVSITETWWTMCWCIQAIEKQASREKIMTMNSSLKLTAGSAAAGTSSAHQQHAVQPSNSSSSATPSRTNPTGTRYYPADIMSCTYVFFFCHTAVIKAKNNYCIWLPFYRSAFLVFKLITLAGLLMFSKVGLHQLCLNHHFINGHLPTKSWLKSPFKSEALHQQKLIDR